MNILLTQTYDINCSFTMYCRALISGILILMRSYNIAKVGSFLSYYKSFI